MDFHPTTSTFLFVNKNASSHILTQSESGEKHHILSHVQGRRRQRAGRKLEPEPWRRYTSSIAAIHKDDLNSEGKIATKSSVKRPATCLPQVYPEHNESDPFHCTAIGADAHKQPMLFHAFFHFSKPAFLAEAFASSSVPWRRAQMRHDGIIVERMRCCVHDEMLMYATLAYSSSCIQWTRGIITEDGRPPEYFIDKALQAVRARLSNPNRAVDTWLLISIYALAVTGMWHGIPQLWGKAPSKYRTVLKTAENYREASRIHLRALAVLVTEIGGWKCVHPYVLKSMILADKFLAIADAIKPTLPLAWDPGPLVLSKQSSFQVPTGCLLRLGEGFTRMELRHDLADVLLHIVEYCRAAHGIWGHCAVTSDDERWLYLRLQALIYQLLLLHQLPKIENCIRLATLLFLQNVTQYQGFQILATIILRQFDATVLATNVSEVPEDSEVLLWCSCMGGMATEKSDEKQRCFERIASLTSSLSLQVRESHIQELLEKYFFIAERQKDQLLDLVRGFT
ncbi:hypothetical protein EV356DRAFT_504176 [Viridothelium virens]|uniref:Transcription factor domain-containing protein n=1 Tax=Viridothelium virens TaxID=1048519 RepID=A0A6A6HN21_VIRVR|nr:hypothetical protein EV356DRAFT_504176 [Viridothelium virens]